MRPRAESAQRPRRQMWGFPAPLNLG